MIEVLEAWHLTHPLLATVAVMAFAALGKPRYGAVFAVGFYFGREVTHASRSHPGGPWWRGFDLTRWSLDNHLDFWPVLGWVVILVLALEAGRRLLRSAR